MHNWGIGKQQVTSIYKWMAEQGLGEILGQTLIRATKEVLEDHDCLRLEG